LLFLLVPWTNLFILFSCVNLLFDDVWFMVAEFANSTCSSRTTIEKYQCHWHKTRLIHTAVIYNMLHVVKNLFFFGFAGLHTALATYLGYLISFCIGYCKISLLIILFSYFIAGAFDEVDIQTTILTLINGHHQILLRGQALPPNLITRMVNNFPQCSSFFQAS